MKPNFKAMERAMMVARNIAERVDPSYGEVQMPPVSGGIPAEYQMGGSVVDPNMLKELAKGAISAINKGRAGLADGGKPFESGEIQYERQQIENPRTYPEAPAEAGELPVAGGLRGGDDVLPPPVQADPATPLEGLPTEVKVPMTGEMIKAGPDERIRKVATDYMQSTGREYKPAQTYSKVSPDRASRIAKAYEEMKHDPSDSFVRASYDQMLKETMDQYRAAKDAGFKAEFWNPEKDEDPYMASPRLAIKDINENHHMYVFPTRAGFGSDEEMAAQLKDNPLLADSGERWNGEPVTYNDIFRAVHDYFGHAKEGVGFRADGEENAWRSHAAMYSPLALPAMTSETRGQNSWLNYGPHGESNRKARTEDTVFADQKIGVLPLWAIHEGAEDFLHPEHVAETKRLYSRNKRAEGGANVGMPALDRGKAIRRAVMTARHGMAVGGEPPVLPLAEPVGETSVSSLRKPRASKAVALRAAKAEEPMVRGQPVAEEEPQGISIPKFDPEVHAPFAQTREAMPPAEPPAEPAVEPAMAESAPVAMPAQPVTQQTKGLPFPEEDTAFRMRTKLNREAKVASGKKADPGLPVNPRMVIRAPNENLPDFVVGPVTPQDWVERHEKILTPEEIKKSADWYKNIYGNFLQYTNQDEQEAGKMMRAWLVAQQNTSPATAMQNVLLQREQIQRGVPEHLWRAGGMPNPTAAARSVLQDQPIKGGVGQKISDFVDSAEGLDTRSYLGHDPKGGTPFVIDVHSARDTGLVDPALINHLRGLGYNEEDLAKVQTDFEASPSDAQYENRAQWGRDLTDYLNKNKWQGKSNWRPEEIQAVGWMGMTKLTRNAEEDSASGLGRNLRRVSFELAPGEGSPWAAKYGEAFSTLPDEDRAAITDRMSARAMEEANKLAQTYAVNMIHGTGAWQQYQNPAAVAQVLATQEGADILANSIGHMLHQTEVWHNRVKPVTANPKGFAIDFIEKGSDNLANKDQLRDFWQKVMDSDDTGMIQGYQPIKLPSGETGVRVLVDKGGKKTGENLSKALESGGKLDAMLQSLPFKVESQIAEAEISKARNDWKENSDGQSYVQRLREILGSDPSARLGAVGSQLEKELEGLLDQAYEKQGRPWRPEQAGRPSEVTTVAAKKARGKAKSTPEPTAGMASGGIVDRALRVAAQARRR